MFIKFYIDAVKFFSKAKHHKKLSNSHLYQIFYIYSRAAVMALQSIKNNNSGTERP